MKDDNIYFGKDRGGVHSRKISISIWNLALRLNHMCRFPFDEKEMWHAITTPEERAAVELLADPNSGGAMFLNTRNTNQSYYTIMLEHFGGASMRPGFHINTAGSLVPVRPRIQRTIKSSSPVYDPLINWYTKRRQVYQLASNAEDAVGVLFMEKLITRWGHLAKLVPDLIPFLPDYMQVPPAKVLPRRLDPDKYAPTLKALGRLQAVIPHAAMLEAWDGRLDAAEPFF